MKAKTREEIILQRDNLRVQFPPEDYYDNKTRVPEEVIDHLNDILRYAKDNPTCSFTDLGWRPKPPAGGFYS